MKLTKLEAAMYQRLQEGPVRWDHTTNQESGALNRLSKKGYAKYDETEREWVKI